MLFTAYGHRITKADWTYREELINLTDRHLVTERLRSIDRENAINLPTCSACVEEGDFLYVRLKRAISFWGLPKYYNYIIRMHKGGQHYDLAYGNGIIGLASGAAGVVTINTNDLTLVAQCNFMHGASSMQGNSGHWAIRWMREEPDDYHQAPHGEVHIETHEHTVELSLTFPSRRKECTGRTPRVSITSEDRVLGEASRFGNLFEPGFRLGMALRDELPIFRAAQRIDCSADEFIGIVVSAVGIIYCYSPVEDFRG